MANVKHYSDFNGETVELSGHIGAMDNAKFAAAFPGVKGRFYDSFAKQVGYAAGSREPLPVTRVVTFKSNPSRHECDARCINATGRVMNCECKCGGKNHGKGAFNCSAVAA
jgi:hypothetical protein